MDYWSFDTYSFYDHDYSHPPYIETLSRREYKIYGPWACLFSEHLDHPSQAKIRIIALGGSTTSAILESTWTYHLYHRLTSQHESIAILNGGCGTYSSYAEYLKLNRDISTIRPTHVISLSGVNDLILPIQISNGFVSLLIEPLLQGDLFSRLNNVIFQGDRRERWIEESNHMSILCSHYDAYFRRFLQPCLASPHNPLESMSPKLMEMISATAPILGEGYPKLVHDFYQSLHSSTLGECIEDISDLLPNDEFLWADARHPSDDGYKIIADALFAYLTPLLQ
ncbi:hypothetical protein [Prochlorococcus sp. MIT 1306]|uniref:SGNH/GDSL hydrolase family protein n=1 Tax=Prochlorococcus sp. MIT 1306 TaxID=1799667 RepID=UPI0007BC23B5|nr:hypothetical protein [Prochlorococcus sp. MIT 1306]KZR61431.1 hypothetical protein PMIT1306_02212 [Prochlorococcus sp. MIT 1306]